MVIIAVLLGGILGFAGFLTALLVFGSGILAAFGTYLAVGFAVCMLVMIAGLVPERDAGAETQVA